LRERKEDIPVLVEHYIAQLSNMMGRRLKIEENALKVLTSCDFPGNVRELVNCLTRAAISSNMDLIKVSDLSCIGTGVCFSHIKKHIKKEDTEKENIQMRTTEQKDPTVYVPKDERTLIMETLEKVGYVKAKAARLLGMTVRQLNYRVKKYNIPIKKI